MALLYIPIYAFEEYEMIELIKRHIQLTDYPVEVEYNKVIHKNKKIISFKNKEMEKTIEKRTLFTEKDLHLLLQHIELNQDIDSIRLASTGELSIVIYRDALLIASESVKTINTATLDYESFFNKVLCSPIFPIQLTFCLGGTTQQLERVYQLTLEDVAWERLLETHLVPQLRLPIHKLLIKRLYSSKPELDVFMKVHNPTELGNFVMSRDAANHYHFLDHMNETIIKF